MGRARVGLVVLVVVSLAGTACGDDDGGSAAGGGDGDGVETTTSPDPRVDHEDSEGRFWSAGTATVELDGETMEFDVDFCATQPAEELADAPTVTLQVDGIATGGAPVTLSIVETVDAETRIQTVTVRFEDDAGTRTHTWEAQRVVDLATGEVDDLHGDGTSPLLDVDEGRDLAVSATDAAFWEFGMAPEDDSLAGIGSARATCTGG